MDIIGVITEYNPFHNGHIYHINKITYNKFIIINKNFIILGIFYSRGMKNIVYILE